MKKYLKIIQLTSVTAMFLFAIYSTALAQSSPGTGAPRTNQSGGGPSQEKVSKLTVPIPTPGGIVKGEVRGIGDYVRTIYQFAIGIGLLLALGSIVFGGIQYTVSAGNVSIQQDARDRIKNAIYGIVLLMASVLILFTINPNLISPTLGTIPGTPPPLGSGTQYGGGTTNPNLSLKDLLGIALNEQAAKIKTVEEKIKDLEAEKDTKTAELDKTKKEASDCSLKIQQLTADIATLDVQIAAETEELKKLELGYNKLDHGRINAVINETNSEKAWIKNGLIADWQYKCIRYERLDDLRNRPELRDFAQFKNYIFNLCQINSKLSAGVIGIELDKLIDGSLQVYIRNFQAEDLRKQIAAAKQQLAEKIAAAQRAREELERVKAANPKC